MVKVAKLVHIYLTRRIEFDYDKSSRDGRTRWYHLSTIPGTTPHCLDNTGGNVNFLGTRSGY